MRSFTLLTLATLLCLTLAKTDLSGCTSTTAGASIIFFVPGTGELCNFLDCGGGRAPPKITVPGCPQYVGTATYSPSFLPGFGAAETGVLSTVSPTATGGFAQGTITSAVESGSRSTSGAQAITLSGERTLSPSSVVESIAAGSSSSSPVSTSGSGSETGAIITSTSSGSTPTGSSGSKTTSTGSSPSSSSSGTGAGSGSRTGTASGTAAGATSTGNAGSASAVNGVVGIVAAGVLLLL